MSAVSMAPDDLPTFVIRSRGGHFRDVHGRTLMLRGVNIASSSKTPVGQPGRKLEGFWEGGETGNISYVGRTFDIESGQADIHLGRLRVWGFNTLRFVFTWEALEHMGPGKYDQDYVDYVVHMLRKCKAYGFRVYMDPHQDCFSRFSGGSGAPYWALIACGMNPRNFTATGAAYIECEWPTPASPAPADFPDMIWATNYTRLANQTLHTLFWAGKDYAPLCVIDGENIQDWLQRHFMGAVRHLARSIREAGNLYDSCVIGWDSINEPNEGLIGAHNLTKHDTNAVAILRIGPTPTAFEAMRLGMGERLEVERWKFGPLGPKRDGSVIIDPQGKTAWLSPEAEPNGVSKWGWKRSPSWKLGQCVWALHGVWDIESKEMIRHDYFRRTTAHDKHQKERDVDFGLHYWRCHWRKYAAMIEENHPLAIHFVHTPVFQIPPPLKQDIEHYKGRACHSLHFYDGLTLVTKHWNWFNADAVGMLRGKYSSVLFSLRFGERAIRNCLREQLGTFRQDTFDQLGDIPTMMGEIGVPYDLDKKAAYASGDYHNQARALDASLNACDGGRPLNYTVWTYCPDNQHAWGDQWNGEDLSIWSQDDAERTQKQRTGQPYVPLNDSVGKNLSALTERGPRYSNSSSTTSVDEAITAATMHMVRHGGTSVSAHGLYAMLNPSNTELPGMLSYLDLNDGARALPAFCRPYPQAIVGRPTYIDFNLKSSVFTLSVEVAYGDMTLESSEKIATEIYMPLVHYASMPKAVAQAVRNDDVPSPDSSNGQSEYKLQLERTREPDTASEKPGALDLDVNVDEGTTWEVEGQILRWFYPRPLGPDDRPIKYTLTAKRASGPVKTWQRQYGNDGPEAPFASFLDDLLSCPTRCSVM